MMIFKCSELKKGREIRAARGKKGFVLPPLHTRATDSVGFSRQIHDQYLKIREATETDHLLLSSLAIFCCDVSVFRCL